jgi:hypothetical protein
MVEKKMLFNPGQMVTALNGLAGMVMDQEMYDRARKTLREGGKAGRHFTMGCCQNPDYITRVPVLFEDGTYDVMRSMNIKKKSAISEEKNAVIQSIMQKSNLTG